MIFFSFIHSFISVDETFYRGCMKGNSKGRHLCEEDAARCEVCDENACNSQMKWEMNSSNCVISNVFYYSSIFAVTVWSHFM